jgi:hypothetical protein
MWNLSYVVQFFKCTHMTYALRMCFITYDFASSMFLQSSSMTFFICMPLPSLMSTRTLRNIILYFIIFNCSPWIANLYEDAAERNAFQGLSLDAFLSEVHKSF